MGVFISHSSADSELAARVEKTLEGDGLEAWLDRSEIRLGSLLRDELQTQLKRSRAVVLLWSKPAASSRWVAAEVLTAFHLGRFIVPCVLDRARLPQFLANTVYVDFRKDEEGALKILSRAARQAPKGANAVSPLLSSQSPELREFIQVTHRGQALVTGMLGQRKLAEAREFQKLVDDIMRKADKAWRFDSVFLNLNGYHLKNAYMVKHWDAIQGGRAPADRLLQRAERFFFDTLFVNPLDYSALNGLGSILLFERELDAAEFFIRRAAAIAERDGLVYHEAQHDLQMVLYYKAQQMAAPRAPARKTSRARKA